MLAKAEQIYTARGKKVRRWDPKTDSKDDILRDVIGRSGTLRVPTLQVGQTFLVGFNQEMFERALTP